MTDLSSLFGGGIYRKDGYIGVSSSSNLTDTLIKGNGVQDTTTHTTCSNT
jgi:hypothetical protein